MAVYGNIFTLFWQLEAGIRVLGTPNTNSSLEADHDENIRWNANLKSSLTLTLDHWLHLIQVWPPFSGLFKSFENIPTALTMKLRMIRASALSLVPHLCFFLLWFDKSTAQNATTHPSEGPYQSLFLQTWLNVNLLGLWWCDN